MTTRALFTLVALFSVHQLKAQNDYEKTVEDGFSVNVFKPGKVDVTDAHVARLKAPAGFSVTNLPKM